MPRLVFANHRDADGVRAVNDSSGTRLATVVKGFWSSRFEVLDTEGTVLARGRAHLLGGWSADDAHGARLVRLRTVWWRGVSRAVFGDGAVVGELRGRMYRRDWTLTSADGRALLRPVPADQAWLLPEDSWQIDSEEVLSLAQVAALVELHRLQARQRRRPPRREPELGRGHSRPHW